jgi:hypothetical protein
MPAAQPDPEASASVIIDGQRKWFSEAVTELLLGAGKTRAARSDP